MVGVPRSSGCQLCRRRRVKCDEARPGCGNCLKYGTECPGYERGIKFVSGKHKIRQRGSQNVREGSASSGPSSSSISSPESGSTASIVRSDGEEDDGNLSMMPSFVVAPSPNRAQFICTILEAIPDRVSQRDVMSLFSWLLKLDRLGTKVVLDGSMCALAMQLVGKDLSDHSLIAHSRTLYGQSLAALQASLRHRTEWKNSETLCSAILLCTFELFAGTTSADTWLQHARGIGVLMEQRGPAAHAEGWDAAMILSFRGILIMSDMFFPRDDVCFLTRPEWKLVIRDRGRHLIHAPNVSDHIIQISDDFVERLAEVPEVLKWGYLLRMGLPIGSTEISYIAQKADDARIRFDAWYEDFQTLSWDPLEVLSEDPESLYASILEHKNSWVGSLYMAYWASMLIIQETLKYCDWPVNFDGLQREYVKNILRSVESVGKGIMGPYRVGFSLRIAYELASVEAQEWIRNRLDSFNKRYAATDKKTYPSPRIDQEGYS